MFRSIMEDKSIFTRLGFRSTYNNKSFNCIHLEININEFFYTNKIIIASVLSQKKAVLLKVFVLFNLK